VIYSTASIIVQTAVINMSHVEDDISKRINNARDSTAVEQQLCKDYPLHCPMANMIMKGDKKTITEGNRALRNIKIVCKNKDENNDHLHLSNPIIYSTIYGSASQDTMTAISQASAISQAHSLAGTETPKRSNNIRNATHSKTGSWSIPEEKTRQESEALKTHFMPAINAILEHENIKGNKKFGNALHGNCHSGQHFGTHRYQINPLYYKAHINYLVGAHSQPEVQNICNKRK
jgi:hypothetical protein